jgi:hypothetical protein
MENAGFGILVKNGLNKKEKRKPNRHILQLGIPLLPSAVSRGNFLVEHQVYAKDRQWWEKFSQR